MKNIRVIYQKYEYRIVEHQVECFSMDDFKGDTFKPECNPDIDTEQLKQEEKTFEEEVFQEGVFCYILEKWNPEVGLGWMGIDSCYMFVGEYVPNSKYAHYIVQEFIDDIERLKVSQEDNT